MQCIQRKAVDISFIDKNASHITINTYGAETGIIREYQENTLLNDASTTCVASSQLTRLTQSCLS